MIDQSALTKARSDPAFGERGWLTFYLCGAPAQLHAMQAGLLSLDAINLGGSEYGFVYAKVPARLRQEDIERRIAQVVDLAIAAGVTVDMVDLDASPDVDRSKFYTIWRGPSS